MTSIFRMYSKKRSDAIEKLSGVRVVATEFVKRTGRKPLFIRSIVAVQNR